MTEKYLSLIRTLDTLLAEAQDSEIPDLIGIGERFVSHARLKLFQPCTHLTMQTANQPHTGNYITAEEAGHLFGMDPRWFYRNKKRLPSISPSRKVLRFHEGKLRKYFENRS